MLAVAAAAKRGAFALDVRFHLPTPGVAALFGRSGCGKSTVVNAIAGLLKPDVGRIEHDGTVLLDTRRQIDVPPEERRMGYVFQDARLFPHLSVAGNLRYAERRAAGRPYVSLDTVTGLLDLGALMDRRTHQLSGGERQRVAIGRALLTQPRLLLLDEPLAALDGARREEVLPYLESLRDRLAVPMVYVTHDFDEVLRLATHIVLMESGTVIAHGEVAEMSLDPHLRSLIGPDQVGAIIDGAVAGFDSASGLTKVRVGRDGELRVQAKDLAVGTPLRVQILARDVIVSTQIPERLSVRNCLAGFVTGIQDDDPGSDLITIDIGGAAIMARITKAATRELSLAPKTKAWALVKSVSLRGHSFAVRTPAVAAPTATSAASPGA
ncbi:MAG TPA: molybdenum ABC transporter ATP-binding protein [Steroidobacteraceae bacterium]|nr:molybdenum ABC transporter ATP-binding protein [Steroidobacteraceae bacterium]